MRRLPEIVLGAVIATAFWSGILLWQSQKAVSNSQVQPTKTEQQYAVSSGAVAEQEKHKGGQKSSWYDTFLNHTPDWLVATFTALLTFVTYRLVSTTGDLRASTDRLWEAGERQIELARETAAAQSRDMQASIAEMKKSADAATLSAQVTKSSIRANLIFPEIRGGQHRPGGIVEAYSFTPHLENAGATHAINVRFSASLMFLAIDDNTFRFEPSGPHQHSVIGPKTTVSGAGRLPMFISDAAKVWRNELKCLMWFRADYDDIMGEPHHTELCVRVGFTRDPRVVSDDDELIGFAPYGPQNTVS